MVFQQLSFCSGIIDNWQNFEVPCYVNLVTRLLSANNSEKEKKANKIAFTCQRRSNGALMAFVIEMQFTMAQMTKKKVQW